MSCSSDDQSDKECPLCMEPLEIDDVNFYPCKCEYQICRFCWHRLRTDENGLCPACRQPYPEDPVNFKPLSTADLQKIKSEKKMKQQAEKQRISESRKHLATYRVLQKNLVYVIGLSARAADPEMLKKFEYFGKYGKIAKASSTDQKVNKVFQVAVGTTTSGTTAGQSNHTAYVTYSRGEDALRAIQGVHNAMLDGKLVKASLGTTKYCSSFLRCQQCYKPECMYLHDMAESDISFTKEDMHAGKHAEYERRLIDNLVRATAVQANIVPLKNILTNKPNASASQPICVQNGSTLVNGDSSKYGQAHSVERAVEREVLRLEEHPPLPPPSAPITVKVHNGRNPLKQSEEKVPSAPRPIVKRKEEKKAAIEMDARMMMTQADMSASPPDDWTSRDDGGPSCSPPGIAPSSATPVPSSPPAIQQAVPSLLSTSPSFATASLLGAPPGLETMRPMEPSPPLEEVPQWQSMLGLAPQRALSPPICSDDDDFGFDPYAESSKELAALVEEERRQQTVPLPAPTSRSIRDPFASYHVQPQPPLQQPLMAQMSPYGTTRLDGGVHHLSGGHSSMSGISLHQPVNHGHPYHHPSPYDRMEERLPPPPGMGSLHEYAHTVHQQHSMESLDAYRFRPFGTSYPLAPTRLTPYDLFSSAGSHAPPPGLSAPAHMQAPPPPGLGPPRMPHHQAGPQPAARQPSSLSEWQDGLKALLPNVNIRFAADLEREQLSGLLR